MSRVGFWAVGCGSCSVGGGGGGGGCRTEERLLLIPLLSACILLLINLGEEHTPCCLAGLTGNIL